MQAYPRPRRSVMPEGYLADNPDFVNAIEENPVFAAIANEVQHERDSQAMKYLYGYVVEGTVAGQKTLPFNLIIEQGTDFKSLFLTGSFFSYDDQNATDFPIPNSLGATAWAGRGLSVYLTETASNRTLTSGFIPCELLGTPGYGLNFQQPYPFRFYFYANNILRFDVRNRDNANRTHEFAFLLVGFKYVVPPNA